MRIAAAALFVLIAIAAVVPLHSYDLFWHLATGRWIVEHRALPASDPFTVASDRGPWINGEWLFEAVLYPIHQAVGLRGLTVARALSVAALFTLAFLLGTRDVAIAGIAFLGANPLLDVRPASVAPLFVVLAIAVARRSWIAFALLTAIWINVHPSALLAPVIMLVLTRSIPQTLAAVAALLVNPFGWRAIAAPISLNAFATSGAFTNAEWMRSSPLVFPLLYLTIIAAIALFVMTKERRVESIVLFAMFAVLAVLHVRHQTMYYAALPMLVTSLPIRRHVSHAIAFAAIVIAFLASSHELGLAPHRWPIAPVSRLKETGLRGNIYNPDQFGGLLIWSFYPERRALTDGRNELYRTFIAEYAVARGDGRAWRALLRKYRIDLAVDEYRNAKVPVVNAVTKQTILLPASLVYWPRAEWALIAYDDAGMVFARRAAFGEEVIQRWEMRGVVPDAAN